MSEVVIIIPGEVIPKQSARFKAFAYIDKVSGKPKAALNSYKSEKVKEYEEKVKLCALEQLPIELRGNPFTGALEAEVLIVYDIPKGMTQKDMDFISQGGIIYKTTLPDMTNNLLKGIFDALEGIVFNNYGKIFL